MVEISVLNYVFDSVIWFAVGVVIYTQIKKVIRKIKDRKNTDD